MSVSQERHTLTLIAVIFFLLVGGPAGLNPDGLEMIALGRGWIGLGPELPAGGYWPPLWPALVTLFSPLLPGIAAGRLLNLLLAGLVVAPLHRLTRRLAGVHGARLAVGLYVGLPAVREHAVVLDARVLGSFLAISTLAWAVEAHARSATSLRVGSTDEGTAGVAWGLAGLCAGLAALTRPEGMAFPLLLAMGALFSGPAVPDPASKRGLEGWLRRLPLATGLAAAVLPAVLRPGAEVRAWESFTGPWLGLWPSRDLVALFGANSAPPATAILWWPRGPQDSVVQDYLCPTCSLRRQPGSGCWARDCPRRPARWCWCSPPPGPW